MTLKTKKSIKQDIDRLLELTLGETETYYECELRHMLEYISDYWEEIITPPKKEYWLTVFCGEKACYYVLDHRKDELKDILRGLREIDTENDHAGDYVICRFSSKEDRDQAIELLASAECYDDSLIFDWDERDAKYVI